MDIPAGHGRADAVEPQARARHRAGDTGDLKFDQELAHRAAVDLQHGLSPIVHRGVGLLDLGVVNGVEGQRGWPLGRRG